MMSTYPRESMTTLAMRLGFVVPSPFCIGRPLWIHVGKISRLDSLPSVEGHIDPTGLE
jgi:hypothetical protein